MHQPGQCPEQGNNAVSVPMAWLCKGSAEFCTRVTNRMMLRLKTQAGFSWGHHIIFFRQKTRTVRLNTRRTFQNVILDTYVEVTVLL